MSLVASLSATPPSVFLHQRHAVAAPAATAVASALPAQPKFTPRQEAIYELTKRQTAAEAALGLQDVDILQL